MSEYIPLPNEITPQWLTNVLQANGFLHESQVVSINAKHFDTFNSYTMFLELNYSSATALPKKLVLKRNVNTDWGLEAGAEEVKFYKVALSQSTYPPGIAPCFAATYDQQSGNTYILLQDLSDTCQPPLVRAQVINIETSLPTEPDILHTVKALATFHAFWWEHPLIQTETFSTGYWFYNELQFQNYFQRRTKSWNSLLVSEKEWLPESYQKLYINVFQNLPNFWEKYLKPRFAAKTKLTLQHGDSYFNNFLCPKDANKDTGYLLDWQTYSFDIGAYDLVNLFATFWTTAQRHEGKREEKMLSLYFETLQENGVKNYSWDEFLTDYKIGLVYWLLMPLQDRFGGSDKNYWWAKMQCLVAAFQDWHCEELFFV